VDTWSFDFVRARMTLFGFNTINEVNDEGNR
jgi:hypothetical protein